MRRSIDVGELAAALGGGLVLVALFLDWFGPATGWEVFETLDLLLTALAAAAIASALASLGDPDRSEARWLLPAGLALTAIVAVQLVDPPPVAAELDVETGAWLALGGGLLVLAGAIFSVSRIDVTVNVRPRQARTRVPAVDRRPSAPGGATAAAGADERPAEPERDARAAPGRTRRTRRDAEAGGRAAGAGGDPDATQPLEPVDRER